MTRICDIELRGSRETRKVGRLNAQPRGLYLSSEVGRESYVPRAEPLNAQPRGLYLSSEVGPESLNAQPRGLYLSSEVGREPFDRRFLPWACRPSTSSGSRGRASFDRLRNSRGTGRGLGHKSSWLCESMLYAKFPHTLLRENSLLSESRVKKPR